MTAKITHIILLTFICFAGVGQTVDADTLKVFTKEVTTSYSVHKIEPMLVQEINGKNLGEVLRNMSPNFIKVNGPGGIATISLRGGSASQTQIFWEGMAINSPTLGQTDLSLLPTEFFTGVSIHHTGASSQLGLGGLAGSLSINSRNQYSYGGTIHFDKEMGSFGLDNTSAKVTLAHNSRLFSETVILKKYALNDFSYHDYSKKSNPSLIRNNASFTQQGAQENLQFRIKKGWVKLVTNYTNTQRGIPVAIGVQDQDQSLLDRNFRAIVQYKTSKTVQSTGVHRAFTHKASIGLVHDYQNYRNLTTLLNSTYNTTTYSAQFHSRFELKKNYGLNTQINEYFYQANSAGFSETAYQNRFSGSVSGWKNWDMSRLNFSVQELLIDDKLSPIIGTIGGYYAFEIGKQYHELFGNAGTNYRYPTLNDLYWSVGGNKDLQPERSLNFEAGFKNIKTPDQTSHFKIDYSFTYFHDLVNNWIQWVPNSSGIWTPENVKSVQKQGVEAQLQVSKRFQSEKYLILTSGYRWVEATVSRSNVSEEEIGKQLIYTPNHVVNLDGTIQLKRIYFRYSQKITSKFHLDRDNKTYLPYSAPADLTFEYRFKEKKDPNTTQLNVALTIHNIWDEDYQIVANQPMPGRWFSVKLMYNLFNTNFGKPSN